jgi:hypothetical protein
MRDTFESRTDAARKNLSAPDTVVVSVAGSVKNSLRLHAGPMRHVRQSRKQCARDDAARLEMNRDLLERWA